MSLSLKIRGSAHLQEVAELLRGAKRKLAKELSVAFHDAGQETLYAIKGNVLSMNIRGRRVRGATRRFSEVRPGTHLRSRIADAVKLDIKTSGDNLGVTFRVDSASMGGQQGGGNIPYHLETRGYWRHPVMGHEGRGQWGGAWASNVGESGWFYKEATDAREEFQNKCDEAIARTIEAIQEEI